MQLSKTETNPFVLNSKSSKGSQYPVLDQELFAWFRGNATKHAALTYDRRYRFRKGKADLWQDADWLFESVCPLEAIQVRAEDDAEDADDSASHVSVSLKGARELFAKGKIFVQDNQSNPSMQKFLDSVEGLVRALEAMTLSSRTHQSALSN